MAGLPRELLFSDERGVRRCWWCAATAQYVAYHDREWGFPTSGDIDLYEKVCLEGFQAGLSWLTILGKRENFRRAFLGFDFERVARLNRRSIERLMGDAGIVRNRAKIESTLNNARRALEARDEFGSLAELFWQFAPEKLGRPAPAVTKTRESTALSKALKQRGWTFVGPTTMHALMQSAGMVVDHIEGCAVREKALAARRAFLGT